MKANCEPATGSGQKHYTTEIVANEMQMLDSRGEMGFGGGGSAPGPSNSGGGGGMDDFGPPPADDFDDDIPF